MSTLTSRDALKFYKKAVEDAGFSDVLMVARQKATIYFVIININTLYYGKTGSSGLGRHERLTDMYRFIRQTCPALNKEHGFPVKFKETFSPQQVARNLSLHPLEILD